MQDLYIAATGETPEIDFAFSQNRLRLSGESYPENAMSFYGPIRASLDQYLKSLGPGQRVEADFMLKYFNSSSTKLIRMLVGMLNEVAVAGVQVAMQWHHDPEDDMMQEYGMDLQEEFQPLGVRLVELEAG